MSEGNKLNGERAGGSGPATGERTPPLSKELNGVGTPYSWKFGDARPAPEVEEESDAEGSEEAEAEAEPTEIERLQAQVRELAAALEDIVTFALSSADYKERAIMMHRRAAAALSRFSSGVPGRNPR